MLILFSSMFLYEFDMEKIGKACKKAGYDGIEFWIETPDYWETKDESRIYEVRDLIKSMHCAVFDLNPCSINEHVVEATVRTNLHAIGIASKLNASFTIHAGKRSVAREPEEDDYRANSRYFEMISRYARIKRVRILLENSEPKINNLCKDFDEVVENALRYGFGITFDINHALKSGDAERYLNVLDRIENVHVSYYNESGVHVGASKSHDVEEILKKIAQEGYNGMITVELDDLGYGNIDYRKKIEILKREREFIERIFKK